MRQRASNSRHVLYTLRHLHDGSLVPSLQSSYLWRGAFANFFEPLRSACNSQFSGLSLALSLAQRPFTYSSFAFTRLTARAIVVDLTCLFGSHFSWSKSGPHSYRSSYIDQSQTRGKSNRLYCYRVVSLTYRKIKSVGIVIL